MGGISLTASMRSNLLSLQNISGQVSSTQNKLATGNKVNSAIDNPSSYYTALSLNNRADDLNALLDSMGQAVSTIKAATTALESATEFLEQASAVATQALETAKIPSKSFFEEKEDVAAVVSTWDELKAALDSGKQGNIVIYGNIEAKDTINLKAGQNLVGVGYYGIEEPDTDKFSQLSFDLASSGKLEAIKANADNLTIADLSIKVNPFHNGRNVVIDLRGTSSHTLQNLDIVTDTSGLDDLSVNDTRMSMIFGGTDVSIYGKNSLQDYGNNSDRQIRSYGMLQVKDVRLYGELNVVTAPKQGMGVAYCSISTYQNSKLNIVSGNYGGSDNELNLYDNSQINIKGGPVGLGNSEGINLYGSSRLNITSTDVVFHTPSLIIQNSADSRININSSKFSYNGKQGEYKAVIGATVQLNGTIYVADQDVQDTNFSDNRLPAGFVAHPELTTEPLPSLDWLAEQNANRDLNYNYTDETGENSKSYQEIINQYDSLIKDASYKGINLLQTDRLSVKFNETNTADLNVQGKDMSSKSLGIGSLEWNSQTDISQAIEELTSAINAIRSYSSELGNNYNIITTRQDFTESLINVLTEGADKLTLADMNEESANMLALQTRQQLAINSLSLASQASQSILKLF